MIADDYTYCFSFAGSRDRITSPIQILPSLTSHYRYINGRLIVHGISHLMLMLPPVFFDILNAGMFCLLCFIIYDFIWKINHDTHNALLYLTVVAVLWCFTPSFGEVFLWLDGSCNYMWSIVLLLFYIRPLLKNPNTLLSPLLKVLYICTGFIMGGLIESVSLAVMGFFIIWPLYLYVIKKKRDKLWMMVSAFTMLPGYLFMILSPATVSGKIDKEIHLESNFLKVCYLYRRSFQWLLIAGILMVAFMAMFKITTERFVEVLIWICLSFGMNCMHCIASYFPKRSMLGPEVFLIIADGILLAEIFDYGLPVLSEGKSFQHANAISGGTVRESTRIKHIDYFSYLICFLISVYMCAFTIYQASLLTLIGTRDIYHSWEQMRRNELYILQEVEKGNLEITIDTIQTSTYYSVAHSIEYIDTQNVNETANKDIAKYYGASRIIGRATTPTQ